jgi:hypothetical protein
MAISGEGVSYRFRVPLDKKWFPLYEELLYRSDLNIVPLPGEFNLTGSERDQIRAYERCIEFAIKNGLDIEQVRGDIPEYYGSFEFTLPVKKEGIWYQVYNDMMSGDIPEHIKYLKRRMTFKDEGRIAIIGTEEDYIQIFNSFFNSALEKDTDTYTDIQVKTPPWYGKRRQPKEPDLLPEDTAAKPKKEAAETKPINGQEVFIYFVGAANKSRGGWRGIAKRLNLADEDASKPNNIYCEFGNGNIDKIFDGLAKRPNNLNPDIAYNCSGEVQILKKDQASGIAFDFSCSGRPTKIAETLWNTRTKLYRGEIPKNTRKLTEEIVKARKRKKRM